MKRLIALGFVALLAACGGGGGGGNAGSGGSPSSVLSGTAAGGAAVIGNVIVTDSKGLRKTNAIQADGSYTVDVSGMTPPFVLKAAGTVGDTSVTYYSAATSADVNGTINITPFTNLIVSNIAGQLAETYFENPANLASLGTMVTPTALNAARDALASKLAPVLSALGVANSVDLLRTSFATDHSGLDAALDLVKIQIDPATNVATLVNALDNATLGTDDLASSADDATTVDTGAMTGINTTTVSDMDAIATGLNNFAALFANGLPSANTILNSGLLDTTNFLLNGSDAAAFANGMSLWPEAVGLQFTNTNIQLDASGTSATVTALITSSTGTLRSKVTFTFSKSSGTWKFLGNGRKAYLETYAIGWKQDFVTLSTGASVTYNLSGLRFNIDPMDWNSNGANTPIASAVVTGPGLGTGLTLVQGQNTWLTVAGLGYDTDIVQDCASTNNAPPCVDVAAAKDNSTYTVVLLDALGNSLNGAGDTITLAKAADPAGSVVLATLPDITSMTISGVQVDGSNIGTLGAGKTLGIAWTMPADVTPEFVAGWANTATGVYFRVEKNLTSTATSASLSIATGDIITTGTPTSASVWLEGRDVYGRAVAHGITTQ